MDGVQGGFFYDSFFASSCGSNFEVSCVIVESACIMNSLLYMLIYPPVQMLEYKLQQETVIQEDLKKSLRVERGRVSELTSQSGQERANALQLTSDLSATQTQLSKVKDALEREQHRFTSVT